MGFGWFWMIIFWVLVIVGVVYIVRVATRSGRKQEKDEAPLDILKKRYAKGEISKEEFEKMRDDLMKS
jgi:putative membrane protein